MRPRNPMCPCCKVKPKHKRASYCLDCKRATELRYRRSRPSARPPSVRTGQDTEACNCHNDGCSGLTCDVVVV